MEDNCLLPINPTFLLTEWQWIGVRKYCGIFGLIVIIMRMHAYLTRL